jgi:hypothetical protein
LSLLSSLGLLGLQHSHLQGQKTSGLELQRGARDEGCDNPRIGFH